MCDSSGTRKKKPLPQVVVDLDAAPENHLADIAKSHKTYIEAAMLVLKQMFKGDKYDQFLKTVVLPEDQRRELQGVADAVGYSFETALLSEFYYELDALDDPVAAANRPADWPQVGRSACSGIVAQGSDGTIYHGRNQDYPPPFTPLQYDGLYQRNGKTVYEATNFASFVGIGGTCMVPGRFSVQVNARGSHDAYSFEKFLADAAAGKPSSTYLMRQACERGDDFHSTVKFLAETPTLGANVYYIIAGVKPGEGAVIQRFASGENTVVQYLEQGFPEASPWYLFQGNDDPGTGPYPAPILPDVFGLDLRNKSAHALMDALSPDGFGLDELWAVMSDNGDSTLGPSSWGVYNQATIHTELVIPATGEYHTYEGHEVVAASSVAV